MRRRDQLETIRDLLTAAKGAREHARTCERLARSLARAWDAEDRRDARRPKLPFPKAGGELAQTGAAEAPADAPPGT